MYPAKYCHEITIKSEKKNFLLTNIEDAMLQTTDGLFGVHEEKIGTKMGVLNGCVAG